METGKHLILKGGNVVCGKEVLRADIYIDGDRIAAIVPPDSAGSQAFPSAMENIFFQDAEVADMSGLTLMPGGIDAHVHFRQPGMTEKADIASESTAAVLGGITSFVDMPNTKPPTTILERLEEKYAIAAKSSIANYGFHIGATADGSFPDLPQESGTPAFGLKVFMGSSTGNLLIDNDAALRKIFRDSPLPVLVHSEDEALIKAGLENVKARFGDDIPFSCHPLARPREACIKATRKAISLAGEYGTRLHILHVSTAEEVSLIRSAKSVYPGITAETSANYLWFSSEDYPRLGARIKCNPAIKDPSDRAALLEGIKDGTIDTIGSDHAPHLPAEKEAPYLCCPSGIPSIQQSLPVLITIAREHGIPLPRIAGLMATAPARILGIRDRGALAPGMMADIVAIDTDERFTAGSGQPDMTSGTAYKCGWTPYEGTELYGAIKHVLVNGVFEVRDGRLTGNSAAKALCRQPQFQARTTGAGPGSHVRA